MSRLFRSLCLLMVMLLPAVPATAAEEGKSQFAGVDGALVHYQSWGKGEPAIVLVHGWSCDTTVWKRQIAALSKSHRVIALDMPGFGQSGKPDQAYTLEALARGVTGVLDDAGVKRAVLVGHSMGFPVSLIAAQERPQVVAGVVSMDGAVAPAKLEPPMQAWLDAMVAGVRGPKREENLKAFLAPFSAKLSPSDNKEITKLMLSADANVAASSMENFAKSALWQPQPKSPLPVLGLYAQTNQGGFKQWLDARYEKPQVHVWSDVDHWPQLEQPKRVNDAILKFVAGLPAK